MSSTPDAAMQPLLRSARLLLRPACSEDLDELLALWREHEVSRYLGDGDSPTREQAAARLAACLGPARKGLGLWRLYRLSDGAALGCVTLQQARRPGTLEPTATLHPQWRGRGYAQEALAALLVHAAEALGALDLVAHCCVPDRAGDRLLRRLGFVGCFESDAGRYRVRRYRPGLRRSDTGFVTRLFRPEQRSTALLARAA